MSWLNSSDNFGGSVSSSPKYTSPRAPSIDIESPSERVLSPFVIVFSFISIINFSAPTTHGFPIPLATTAAWLVIPPFVVKIPTEEFIPWISSGLVSSLTKITFLPFSASISAVSASNTITPTAAPGEAFNALPNNSLFWDSMNCGCNKFVMLFASTISIDSSLVVMFSLWKSIAILTSACAVLLAFRVWSKYTFSFSIVNSISWTSL